MDGAYTKLNTAHHASVKLDTKINLSWDPMHRIELVYGDSKKLSPGHFIENAIEVITAVSTKFKWAGHFIENAIEVITAEV